MATGNDLVFHVHPLGMLTNRVIQYMVALTFCHLVPGCRISNVRLPEWGIEHPPIENEGPVEFERREQHVDLPGLTARMRAGEIRRVVFEGYGQRMENFLEPEFYRPFFRPPFGHPVGFDERFLVCHVRAAEAADGHDPNYPLTPVEFYADLVAETGLRPVFVGQTEPNDYTMRLREHFPTAIFFEPRDVILDFETIRQSKNVVIGVSTYGWLAAWLSHADRVFLTVNGLLNPMQYRHGNLLPIGDPRYRFYLFPINYGVPLDQHVETHRRIAPYWRYVPQDVLQRQFAEQPRFPCTLDMMMREFDPMFYLEDNADVAAVFGRDNAAGARHHYEGWGFPEVRLPFRLDRRWYASAYPMAAFEVAQGDYRDFAHHYVAVGRARGHRLLPE